MSQPGYSQKTEHFHRKIPWFSPPGTPIRCMSGLGDLHVLHVSLRNLLKYIFVLLSWENSLASSPTLLFFTSAVSIAAIQHIYLGFNFGNIWYFLNI